MYGLLITASLLIALQFMFNQQFRKCNGEGLDATLKFSLYTNAFSCVIMLVMGKFQYHVTWFSLLIAFFYAIVLILFSYASLKSLATANLSVFSIFTMLGSILLPTAYGFIFCDEEITWAKILCIVLIIVSTALTYEKGNGKSKGAGNMKYYIAVFILNGLVGTLSKMHQYNQELAVDSNSFMATVNAFCVIICIALLLIKNKKLPGINKQEFKALAGYAGSNGVGNLFALIALIDLPASVHFPILTGGVMTFSTLISFLRKEKPSVKTIISVVIAIAATVLIMF